MSINKAITNEIVRQGTSIPKLSRQLNMNQAVLRRFIANSQKQADLLLKLSKALNHNFMEDLAKQIVIEPKAEQNQPK